MKNRSVYGRRMSSGLSIFVITGLAALLMVSAFSCGRKREEPPPREVIRPVKLLKIEGATTGMTRSFPGRIRASQRVDLAFQVSGPLTELPVDEGQAVKKGQVIARILPRDFETEITKARARALEAEQQFARYRELFVKKQVSKADFDRYRANNDIAKARLQDAENALKDTYLRAPFAGVIARRHVENFQDVQAKQPIVSLQDISSIEVLVDVPESSIARLKAGSQPDLFAEFSSAPGRRFELELREFAAEADPRTQTYQVTFVMPQPEGINILPGMTVSATAVYPGEAQEGDRIVIPAIAVFSDESGQAHVWVLDEETSAVGKRQVVTGDLAGTSDIEIADGLKPGETIATSGVNQLREGMKVRPLEQP